MKFLLTFTALFLFTHFAFSEEKINYAIDAWITTAPLEFSVPLFTDSTKTTEKSLVGTLDLDLSRLEPNADDFPLWFPNQALRWSKKTGEMLSWSTDAKPTCGFAASYISSTKFQSLNLKFETTATLAVYVNGKKVDTKVDSDTTSKKYTANVTFHRGKHLLIIEAVTADKKASSFSLKTWFELDSISQKETVSFSTDKTSALSNFSDWGKFRELSVTGVSYDGKYVSVINSSRDSKYKKSSWIEIFERASGKRVCTIRGDKTPGSPQWYPKSYKLAYTTGADDGTVLWVYDLNTNQQSQALKAIKDLGKYVISPDERLVYFSKDDEKAPEHDRYDKFEEITDRVSDWSNTRKLYVASLQNGSIQTLTGLGDFALDNWELSPEGYKIIFNRGVPKKGRPYYYTEYWVFDLKSGAVEKVLTQQLTETPENFCWLPGEKQVAYQAGGFESLETDTVFHGVNQRNLYLLDLATKSVANLSNDQLFSLKNIFYNPSDKKLWFNGELGGKIRLFKTDPLQKGKFEEVNNSQSIVDLPVLSKDGSTLVYSGSSPLQPFALFAYDTKKGSETKILDPNSDLIEHTQLASYEKFDFENPDGFNIEGWVYKPADFNPNEKYPLVVYYYAGVSPRDERFSFSYQWLCANGYVVYILNPVGCVGYGQKFSDYHSNDWGTFASRDVILGTQKILAAKPYLNEKKVACYGGSYGGFATLDVLTKTNLFACACDMYGISNITNYFGAGMWGYLYGDLALPGSYPWKNKEIFVNKSPIYSADKIKTPLLILHGAADTNVPPTESDQMFVALKLLGRDDVVEVKFKDETHNINTNFENLIDHREMMLEWFDKYLKGEPQGWEARWAK